MQPYQLSLSLSFQAFLMLVMPLFARNDCSWIGGAAVCDLFGSSALFLLVISPLTTILMAFDRVLALYQPFMYRSHVGMRVSTEKRKLVNRRRTISTCFGY